jgi:hypothetical protein
MKLLHYGLQRSGTNYLETLLKKKYQVRFLNSNKDRRSPLQKHFRLYDNKDIIPEPQYRNNIEIRYFDDFEHRLKVVPDYYLIISKDPYSWYLSYNNWAKKCNWPDVAHHYIMEYNLFYGKWLEFSRQTNKVIFVRYVDLIGNTNEKINDLASSMGLRSKSFGWLTSSSIGKVNQSGQFTDDRITYYLKEKYLECYTEEKLQEINSFLDPQVISLLGYKK